MVEVHGVHDRADTPVIGTARRVRRVVAWMASERTVTMAGKLDVRDWRRWITIGKRVGWGIVRLGASSPWLVRSTMTATIMDGHALAADLRKTTTDRALQFGREHGRRPCLATVLVGEDPASRAYVRMKTKRCESVGIDSRRVELPAPTTTVQLVDLLDGLSADDEIDGILLQHPVPTHVDERAAFEAINPAKDVDGVTGASFASMAFGEPGFQSATPGGILRLLDAYGIGLSGQRAVIVGRSPILGKPAGMLLLARDATVTFCHSHTRDLPDRVVEADIVIAAVGRPELVQGAWIKPGATVIDAGYNPGTIGDVEFVPAAERAAFITPVPGGVGPMTIAVLLAQTVDAANARAKSR
jgi:methylenetetrahydrofolate dehydrogenase (NADP+) / methenyltetrahydrofolate cyclohydrolase